jgi:hypothetical protein
MTLDSGIATSALLVSLSMSVISWLVLRNTQRDILRKEGERIAEINQLRKDVDSAHVEIRRLSSCNEDASSNMATILNDNKWIIEALKEIKGAIHDIQRPTRRKGVGE